MKAGRKIGSIPWNKGKKTGYSHWLGKKRPFMNGNKFSLGYKHTKEALEKIANASKGRKLSQETKNKIAKAMHKLGRPEHLKGISNPRWRGNNRKSLKKIILKRDGNKCNLCKELFEEIDHIVPVKTAPERFGDLSNLQLLCKKCHRIKTNKEISK